MTRKIYPKVRNGKYENRGMPPHVVLHKEKKVLFLIISVMAYLGIPTFMRNFPDGYKGYVVKTKEKFEEYRRLENET